MEFVTKLWLAEFIVGDISHPEIEEIYAKLEEISEGVDTGPVADWTRVKARSWIGEA